MDDYDDDEEEGGDLHKLRRLYLNVLREHPGELISSYFFLTANIILYRGGGK